MFPASVFKVKRDDDVCAMYVSVELWGRRTYTCPVLHMGGLFCGGRIPYFRWKMGKTGGNSAEKVSPLVCYILYHNKIQVGGDCGARLFLLGTSNFGGKFSSSFLISTNFPRLTNYWLADMWRDSIFTIGTKTENTFLFFILRFYKFNDFWLLFFAFLRSPNHVILWTILLVNIGGVWLILIIFTFH